MRRIKCTKYRKGNTKTMDTNNAKLKQIFNSWKKDFENISEQSRDDYIKRLAPGSVLPKSGIIYGDEYAAAFSGKCTEYRQQASAIIDNELAKLNGKLTAAPTADAVNACTLLSLRKSTDPDDYTKLLDAYGDNVQAGETIRAIAKENGVHGLPADPIKEQAETLESLRGTIYSRITPYSAQQGSASQGHIATYEMMIDRAIPEE